MTHELECIYRGYEISNCPDCKRLRVVYQRGRQDAADEILKAGYQRSLNLHQAVTIARGGEQE